MSCVLFDGSSTFLQVLDLSAVQLVYSSSYFKSLSTGGNVSKALVRILMLIVIRLNDHSTASTLRQRNVKTQPYFFQLLPLGLPSTLIRHENGAFRQRSSNRTNLKTPALRFSMNGKHFENGAFRKR